MLTGLGMALSSAITMVLVIVLALFAGTLFPSQQPGRVWLPVIANGAVWANLVIMSVVLYIIGGYSGQWSGTETVWALIVGMAISWASWYFIYRNGKFDDGLAHPLSLAGAVFFIYGGFLYAAVGLFLYGHPTVRDLMVVGVLFMLYLPIANHAVLNFIRVWSFMPWCPWIFAEETSPLRLIIGGQIAVVIITAIKTLFFL